MTLPHFSRPATEVIAERYSCRAFAPSDEKTFAAFEALREFAASIGPGPLGGKPRFELLASKEGDSSLLRGLGTYGMIKDPAAFLIAVQPEGVEIADLGWVTELAVLKATELGLGSVWLGGTFRRGRFAKAAKLRRGERLAIVIALGREAPGAKEGALRRRIKGDTRKAWAELFSDKASRRPIASKEGLSELGIGPEWAAVLEALRLSPSASNKQPWSLARAGKGWELYLRRDPGYYSPLMRRLGMADMQLNDMGIAMSHIALAAAEKGLAGSWKAAAGAREPKAWPKGAAGDESLLVATFA
jgi:nitroreductase